MPVARLKELVDEALAKGYAVPAINVVDELSLRAVVDAAVELRSPLIVQTSVKTVKSVGRDVLKAMFDATVAPVPVPVSLHLDHCPDRAVITDASRRAGTRCSSTPHELGRREPAPDHRGRRRGQAVRRARRGRDRGHPGVEDGIGSDDGVAASEPGGRHRLHQDDRGRRLRAGDRQRARHVQRQTPTSTTSGSATWSTRPASRWRCTAAPGLTAEQFQRPDRPGLREGQHLHRAQGRLHEVDRSSILEAGARPRTSGIRRRCSATSTRPSMQMAAELHRDLRQRGQAW